MQRLTRQQVQDASDLPKEAINVPEWGGSVVVKTMNGEERDAFEESRFEQRGRDREVNLKNYRAALAVATVVHDDGTPLFTTADIGWLGTKSGKALGRIADMAMRLNGLTKADMEDAVKNSEPAPSAASTTA